MSIVSGIVSVLLVLLICGTVLVILSGNNDSGKKIAWILLIATVPIVGLLLYIVFGLDMRKPGYFYKKHKVFLDAFDRKSDERTKRKLFGKDAQGKLKEDYKELSLMMSLSNGTTVSDGNSLEIITSGKRKFDALIEDLNKAEHHIHMEYFYFRKDNGSRQIKEILMRKAREGVKVRFIHENIANIDIDPRYYNEMKKAGVDVVRFTNSKISVLKLAQLNYRDHRKIVVIDGKIGYTGGMNIGDDYFVRWRDTHIRLTGNAVASLQYSFLNSFITSGGKIDSDMNELFPDAQAQEEATLVQIVPDEPELQWPILHIGVVWVVQHSRDYLYIQTPYFVPPEPLMLALKSAALKGTDVRLMFPQKSDMFYMGAANRSYYEECLEAGIRIFEKTGNFIHAKTLVSDDYLSILGSANMDNRSLELNYEINAYIYDENKAKVNKEIFMSDLSSCVEITLDKWQRRPWYQKMFQSFIRLFSPLL